jgi:hypothetical protein
MEINLASAANAMEAKATVAMVTRQTIEDAIKRNGLERTVGIMPEVSPCTDYGFARQSVPSLCSIA